MAEQTGHDRGQRWHASGFRAAAASLAGVTTQSELVAALDAAARGALANVTKTAFYVREPGEQAMRLVHREGIDDQYARSHEDSAWDRHPGMVCRSLTPLLVGDMQVDARGAVNAEGSDWVRSRMFVPFVVDGEAVGSYGVASQLPHQFDEDDVAWLQLLCDIGAVVWQRLLAQQERERFEETARDAQKLELVGRVVGSVAHDVNNSLSVIMGTASRLSESAEHATRAQAETIVSACRRTSHLTRRLLSFSEPANEREQILCLDEQMRRYADIASSLVSPSVAVRTEIFDDGLSVKMAPGQLEQVMLNLLVNARDEMPSGGALTLGLRADGSGACVLSVRDTGRGIPPSMRDRIFEPFFTTKPAGQGTGLGLSSVRDIVEAAGGTLSLAPSAEGACFEVRLPRVQVETRRHRAAADTPVAGTAVAWIAEDQEPLRRMFSRIVEDAGWSVRAAEDGQHVLDWLDTGAHPAVLVTDVVMPRANGVQVATRLLEQHKGVGVVMVTGYAGTAGLDQLVAQWPEAPLEVLAKPFSPSELIRAIERVAPRRVHV